MEMITICAWCGQDEQGRVVCFRCGAFPAPVKARATPTSPEVASCVPCTTEAGRATRPQDGTHGICASCETKYFNMGGNDARADRR